jgi:hypothetical protein
MSRVLEETVWPMDVIADMTVPQILWLFVDRPTGKGGAHRTVSLAEYKRMKGIK